MLLMVRREAWSATLVAVDREPCVSIIPSGFFARGVVFVLTRPLQLFVGTEARGALLLLVATGAALVWANSPWVASYEALWSTSLSVQVGEAELVKDLRHWVNDGLMTLFFFVVGLELSRQLKLGELRDWRAMTVPAVAALGGMVAPALLYLAFNPSGAAARGWAIAIAGDLALVVGVLALVGSRCPPQLRVLLLTLVIVNNLAAVAVVGLLYAAVVNILALAVMLELFALLAVLRLLRVTAYLRLPGGRGRAVGGHFGVRDPPSDRRAAAGGGAHRLPARASRGAPHHPARPLVRTGPDPGDALGGSAWCRRHGPPDPAAAGPVAPLVQRSLPWPPAASTAPDPQ